MTDHIVLRAKLWSTVNQQVINARQQKIIQRMLEDDFEGVMHTSKYAKLAKCSTDTALRDIQDLVKKGILVANPGRGRNTSYRLLDINSDNR